MVNKILIVLRFLKLQGLLRNNLQKTPADTLRRCYYSESKLESLRWMFETQDFELLRKTPGTEKQELDLSDQTLAPFDCYVVGHCIAKSACHWKLNFSCCRFGEEGMRMLARGSDNCFHNVQEIDLTNNDGLTHLGM